MPLSTRYFVGKFQRKACKPCQWVVRPREAQKEIQNQEL
jgi:hypothetical protein